MKTIVVLGLITVLFSGCDPKPGFGDRMASAITNAVDSAWKAGYLTREYEDAGFGDPESISSISRTNVLESYAKIWRKH